MSLDNIFNNQLSDYESPVDAESIWRAVQPEPRRRLLAGWWWILGLGLLILPGASRQDESQVESFKELEAVVAQELPDYLVPEPNRPEAIKTSALVIPLEAIALKTAPVSSELMLPVDAEPQEILAEAGTSVALIPSLEPKLMTSIPLVLNSEWPWLPELAGGKRGKSRWFSGMGVGVYRPVRELLSHGEAGDQLLGRIRESEKTLEVLGVEWQLGRELGHNWRVHTGLSVHQLTDRFAWTGEEVKVDTVLGTQVIIVGGMGDSTFIPGPVARYQVIRREKTSYNTYRFVDVPVLASFEAGDGPVRFTVTGGVYVNVRTRISGDRLGVDGDFGLLEAVTPMRSRVGCSYYAGMGGVWSAGDHWQLFGQGGIRYFPGMLTVDGGDISQRYQWLGFQLGIRYR
jgi:hypothetical protein